MKSVKVKSALTVVTFGIKVPAGLFIPSMVTGAISGMKSFFEKSIFKFKKIRCSDEKLKFSVFI